MDEIKYAITETIHPGDPYMVAIHSEKYVFYMESLNNVTNDVIACYLNRSFNIHGGLSPWYRGCITLFWPFYFLKPNQAGMTIHRLTQRLDGGEILHHSVPKLEKGDTLHEVACKAVVQVGKDLCEILKRVDNGAELKSIPQKTAGKLFVSSDWNAQHLRVVYDMFDDKIVDMFLNGELEKQELNLVDFLKRRRNDSLTGL